MITTIVFSAAMGVCGTPWPGWLWWLLFKKPRPPWPPPPPPWDAWLEKVKGPREPVPWRIGLGILGGIAGGLLMNYAVGSEQLAVAGLAAFAGGRIASEVAALVRG